MSRPVAELLYPGVPVGGLPPPVALRTGMDVTSPGLGATPDPVRCVLWYPASTLYPGRSATELVPSLALHVTQTGGPP